MDGLYHIFLLSEHHIHGSWDLIPSADYEDCQDYVYSKCKHQDQLKNYSRDQNKRRQKPYDIINMQWFNNCFRDVILQSIEHSGQLCYHSFAKLGPTYRGQLVNPRHQTLIWCNGLRIEYFCYCYLFWSVISGINMLEIMYFLLKYYDIYKNT